MKTVDYYKKAITQALNARGSIEKANADYEHNCELAKNAYEADLLGEKGYKDRLAELAQDRQEIFSKFTGLFRQSCTHKYMPGNGEWILHQGAITGGIVQRTALGR